MKPVLRKSIKKLSNENCQHLCARNKSCIYWWWKKRGNKCYIWNMLYKTGTNMGTGVKNCDSKCTLKSMSSCDTGKLNFKCLIKFLSMKLYFLEKKNCLQFKTNSAS